MQCTYQDYREWHERLLIPFTGAAVVRLSPSFRVSSPGVKCLQMQKGFPAHRIDDVGGHHRIWAGGSPAPYQDYTIRAKSRRLNLADSGKTAVCRSFQSGGTSAHGCSTVNGTHRWHPPNMFKRLRSEWAGHARSLMTITYNATRSRSGRETLCLLSPYIAGRRWDPRNRSGNIDFGAALMAIQLRRRSLCRNCRHRADQRYVPDNCK